MTETLPADFQVLAPFAAWALSTQDARQHKRITSSKAELKAFYDAVLPELPKMLEYVDRYPLGEIAPEARPVFWMALSMAEVAPHVELYRGDPKVPHSFDEARFVAEHGQIPA